MEKTKAKKLKRITEEGDSCRHCGTPVTKQKTREKARGRRAFYYEFYLSCPSCGTMYLHPASKKFWSENSN